MNAAAGAAAFFHDRVKLVELKNGEMNLFTLGINWMSRDVKEIYKLT